MDIQDEDMSRHYSGVKMAKANHRTYIDIETSRTVRPSFTRQDYTAFRGSEKIPGRQKQIIKMCMDAYDNVGIIRNIIDLMGDFACQGMTIVHKNKSEERFYRRWFEQIGGQERSERFLNYLYRMGNVVVRRQTAKITPKQTKKLKSVASNSPFEEQKVSKRDIPWAYEFLNPLVVDFKKTGDSEVPRLYMNLRETTYNVLMGNTSLPEDMRKRLNEGNRDILLDEEAVRLFYYKKDDWLMWSNPMIRPILDDISMLEKMKLADLAALDGAISNVRLWTLGDLEYKIMPKKPAINKLRDILASNVGGGTMDLIWGPDLKFQESNSQVYKFLGSEKYQPVLTSIYAGMGVPPTLTGGSGASGLTNNYVALKTLIERLEYGRTILLSFWAYEFKLLQKAMAFKTAPSIHFDNIILSDEAAIQNLLINLADRDIISNETLLERLGELPEIEKIRVKREMTERTNDVNMPKKASPYHNPMHKDEMAKLAIAAQVLDVKTYFDQLGIPSQDPPPIPVAGPGGGGTQRSKPKKSGGRPSNVKDTAPRKQKRVLPRSKGDLLAIWAVDAQKGISELMTPITLNHLGKKNLRSLTKAEAGQFEYIKLCILTALEPYSIIEDKVVEAALKTNTKPSEEFNSLVVKYVEDFIATCQKVPNLDDMKMIYALVYSEINQN